jgi:Skp family chaperone for outer membrane proteins
MGAPEEETSRGTKALRGMIRPRWHKDCFLDACVREIGSFHHSDWNHLSFDLHTNIGPDSPREVEPTFFFMLNCLLYSRMETGNESNKDFYDEDVNMYLTHLLCSFMQPEYHRRAKKYLSRYDANLFNKIEKSDDVRLKYTIYKTNADFLLISIGIFKNPRHDRLDTAQLFVNSEEAHMGRAKAYYNFAYTYSQSMFRRSTGVSEVLEKLSRGFERYVEILSHMRGEYFNILDRLSAGEVYHLERDIDKQSKNKDLKVLQDAFLDKYSEYLRTKDPDLKRELDEMVRAIKKIDDSFHFHMED